MEIFEFSSVNIGSLIRDRIKESFISGARLARLVNMDQSNLNKLLQKKTMDTEKIIKFSITLRYNFFMEYSHNEQYKNLKDDNFRIDNNIHIGQIIKFVIQSRNLTYDEFCDLLMKQDSSFVIRKSDISKLVARNTLDTSKLSRCSEAVNVNLFEFYCMDARERLAWVKRNCTSKPGSPSVDYYVPAFDLSTALTKTAEEDASLLNQLIKAKSDLAVLKVKYRILQKRLKDAGLPWDVDDVQ